MGLRTFRLITDQWEPEVSRQLACHGSQAVIQLENKADGQGERCEAENFPRPGARACGQAKRFARDIGEGVPPNAVTEYSGYHNNHRCQNSEVTHPAPPQTVECEVGLTGSLGFIQCVLYLGLTR